MFVQGVLREGWGTPRTSFIAALCTKTDVPPKTAKKAKASSKSKGMLLFFPYVAHLEFQSSMSCLWDLHILYSNLTPHLSTAWSYYVCNWLIFVLWGSVSDFSHFHLHLGHVSITNTCGLCTYMSLYLHYLYLL